MAGLLLRQTSLGMMMWLPQRPFVIHLLVEIVLLVASSGVEGVLVHPFRMLLQILVSIQGWKLLLQMQFLAILGFCSYSRIVVRLPILGLKLLEVLAVELARWLEVWI